MQKTLWLIVSVCVGVLFYSGSIIVHAQEKEEPIRIGVLTDYTGIVAFVGPKWRVIQDMYLDEIGYKVAGRPIKLFIEDSGSNPATALEKAKKLVGVDKVHMLVGTILGTISLSIAPFAAEAKIPHIIWVAAHYEAVEKGWSYATSYPPEVSAYIAGKYAYDKGYRTATTIGQDYIAGHKYIGGAIQGFLDSGGKVIQKQWVPLGTQDYSPYLAAMKPADVVFHWLASLGIITFWKQYDEFGLLNKMPLILTEGDTLFTVWLPNVDPKFAGRIAGRTSYTSDIDTPANKKFVASFKAKTGSDIDPDTYDLLAYETWMLAIKALERTNGDTDPEKLRQALRGLTMETPASLVRISEEGFPFRPSYIFELALKDGKLFKKRVGNAYPEEKLIRLRPGIAP